MPMVPFPLTFMTVAGVEYGPPNDRQTKGPGDWLEGRPNIAVPPALVRARRRASAERQNERRSASLRIAITTHSRRSVSKSAMFISRCAILRKSSRPNGPGV